MIRTLFALALAGAGSQAAIAAATLATGSAPGWIRPVTAPADTGKPGEGAFRVLLQDQQVDLRPGHVTRYFENVLRIQTPQGLAAGNISIAWNPDTETATVHRLVIRRGDKVIDVLASQSFTVVRRETNLENAVLDGVLTATIQPEGLQVGDVIDFAASIIGSDPALQSHVEEIGGGWNGIPIDRAHLFVQWPSSVHLRLRETTGLPAFKIERKGDQSSVETTQDALPQLPFPKKAPLRYAIMRVAEMSDFASWADLSRLMAPLYTKASAIPADGPLSKEIATIAAQSSDPKVRAEAALTLVQDRVRYVFLGMNDGGLVPADAETTWSRRFGDCKGKTVLLLALLKGLGIQADPVIVSMGAGDGLDQRLPMVALFNHVMVRATVAGRTYWLDGTRTGDDTLDKIVTPDMRWGLPLVPDATLVPMNAPAPDRPQTETAVRIDATAGITLPAPFHVDTVLRDDEAIGMNRQLADLSPDVRDRGLRDYWRSRYDFVEVKAVSATFDKAAREEHLVMDGDAKMDWNNGWYETDVAGVGYKVDFTRDSGPNRDAPYAVAFPYSIRSTETILLPPGAFTLDHGAPIDVTVGGIAYHRTSTLGNGRFVAEETEHSLVREFPAADAPAAQATLRDLADKTVFIGKPNNYFPTDKEVAAAMATTPTTSNGYVDRGNMLLDRFRLDEAITAFGQAITLDPKSATAYAGRGIAYAWKQDAAKANADLDAAEKIDPKNAVVWRARGLLADQRGTVRDAIAAYSQSLQYDPGNTFALSRRAADYRYSGDYAHALDDAGEVLRQSPGWANMHLMRANIFFAGGHIDDAANEAGAVSAAGPNDAYSQVVAARIYARIGRKVDADKAFDAALAIKPEAYIYINRSATRPHDDFVARQADLDAAARLEPKSNELLSAQAELQEDRKGYADAIASWTAVLAGMPKDGYALVHRGIDQQGIGHADLAEKDFAAARAGAKSAEDLNTLCWEQVVANVALNRALEECQASLALLPGRPQTLDSLGLVQFRLNHLDEAQAAYDKALAQAPGQASSLYGVGLIASKRGDAAKAAASKAAAQKADPDTADRFQRYGLPL